MNKKTIEKIHDDTAQEDATTSSLGEEFSNATCLSISEVNLLLKMVERRKGPGTANGVTSYAKMLNYIQTSSKFNNRDPVNEVRSLLRKESMSLIERAQLANLCCIYAKEAKALIPSLKHKFDDDELQDILDQILIIKKFQ